MKTARGNAATPAAGSVLRQVADLERMSTAELGARWRVLFGGDPPRFNRQFMLKRLAYRVQELAYGGLSMAARERMDRLLDEEGYDEIGAKVKKPGRARDAIDRHVVRGTVFVREWDGERHEVRALDEGFEYRGMPYRSLSAIARAITGTSWNGWVFFGVPSATRKTGGANDAQ